MYQSEVPLLRFKNWIKPWKNFKLKEISTKITDGTHDTPKKTISGYPYITAIHVKNGLIDFKNCFFLSESDHKIIYSRCNPEYGDILMVNIGAGTATVAKVDVEYQFSMKNVALVKPNTNYIYSDFLFQALSFKSAKLLHILSSGGAQPFLSLKQIGNIRTVIPGINEQKKIASFLTSVDFKIEKLTRKKELLEEYKKGVMQKLFSGEIRFKDENGNNYPDWENKRLEDVLDYEQPSKYIVKSTDYNEKYDIPVLTAGKTLLLGKTDEKFGVYKNLPVIIFDDFTMANKLIDFPFKVKSGAIKFLNPKSKDFSLSFIYYSMQLIHYPKGDEHRRYWISEYSKVFIKCPCLKEQKKISLFLNSVKKRIDFIEFQIEKTKEFKKGLLQQMFL